jgi:hypothetical protein
MFLEPGGKLIDHAVFEGESDSIYIANRMAGLREDRLDGLERYLAARGHLHAVEPLLRDVCYEPAVFDQGGASVVADVYAEHKAGTGYICGMVWHLKGSSYIVMFGPG